MLGCLMIDIIDELLKLQEEYCKETLTEVVISFDEKKQSLQSDYKYAFKSFDWYNTEALQRLKRVYEAERNGK
jgi:hypothetical protein